MPQAQHFSDGAGYEQYMGRWSRAVGSIFLDWVRPAAGAQWLDIGCGTGVFTELVLDTCSPAGVVAIDPSEAQVALARQKTVTERADFRVSDAQALPFSDGTFGVVVSALVINFIADPARALAEMRRVGRSGATVAAYVWDFATECTPNSPVRLALTQIGGTCPVVAGTEYSRPDALRSLFAGCGLEDIASRSIEVTMSFPNFDDFLHNQIPSYTNTAKVIAALSQADREKLFEVLRAMQPAGPDGTITYSSRAHAIKARVPG